MNIRNVVIHKQTQLTPTSCVPCCIAMVTGVDQQSIIDEMAMHYDSSGSMRSEFRQWVRMGYLPRALPYGDLQPGQLMLATVPSLNIEAGNHRIIIDWLGDEPIVHDPNEGREGRKVYTYHKLRGWSELTVVEWCRS